MANIHPTQQKIINLLKNNIFEGITIREIQRLIGASSPGVVKHHINQLEKKGILRRNPNNAQDYHILEEKPEEPVVNLNVYSTAQCGPKGLIANNEPVDKIPVATRLLGFPSEQAFIVKAKGSSMKPKINDGDLVIVKKVIDKFGYDNYNNKLVVCVNDEECLIKRVHYDRKTNHVLLESLNPDVPPFIAKENFWIEGEVKGIFSYS